MTDDKEERWQQELDKDREVFFDNGGEDGREKKVWAIPNVKCKFFRMGANGEEICRDFDSNKRGICSYANCQIKVDKDGIPTEIKKVWNNEHDDVWDKIIAEKNEERKQYDTVDRKIIGCGGGGDMPYKCYGNRHPIENDSPNCYEGPPGSENCLRFQKCNKTEFIYDKSENDEKVKKCHKG